MTVVATPPDGALPRELAPGIFWLGECQFASIQDNLYHSYNSLYLVAGEAASMLVEAGHPQELRLVDEQIVELLARPEIPPLKYLFVTHAEAPHSAGLGRLLERFPGTVACGDVTEFHLVFPQFADRLQPLNPGDSLDLGNREFRVVEAVFRDYAYSRWGYDVDQRALFAGDGFAYAHFHEAGHCGHTADEVSSLDLPDMTALFAELAFYWTKFVDLEPYIERLRTMLFDELDVALVAPTHGLPITDPVAIFPEIAKGLRLGGERRSAGPVT